MPDTTIPFELHLTVNDLNTNSLDQFIGFCKHHAAKPIIIELARGHYIHQPMLGKVVYGYTLQDALNAARIIAVQATQHGFNMRRLKIEVPATFAAEFENVSTGFSKYFEWHGKVHYQNTDVLIEIAERHKAHLSRNALNNEQHARFLTLREYGAAKQFWERVQGLYSELVSAGWQVLKQESEYCIYDSNNYLDNGWLPQ